FLLTSNSAKHPIVVSLRTFDQRCSLCPGDMAGYRRPKKPRNRSLGGKPAYLTRRPPNFQSEQNAKTRTIKNEHNKSSSALPFAAMVALLFLGVAPQTLAQSTQDQLVGTWKLVSVYIEAPDGSRLDPFGANPTD